jgi:putative heme iron utilization protein
VKQGADQGPPPASLSASTSTKPEAKPYAEPAAGAGELKLPRESATKDAKKKPAGLTRLLRTPLSGASTRETFSRTRSPLTRSLPDSIPSPTHAYPSRTLPRSLPRALAGGVLNSMKDADLPSVAVAARNLMELADYADLSTIMSNMNHRRTGYPFASTVDFATDADGYPIFCLTPLAMHTRNLAYNSRASLTVKMNGWGGLANARVTIFGDVHRLPPEYQASANEIFKAKYEARKEESDLEDRWGDYTFYRMNNVIDVYFVGGFGTLNWVDLNEYRDATPDAIVTPSEGSSVLDTLAELNTLYGTKLANSGAVAGSAGPSEPSTQGGEGTSAPAKVDDLWIISIDKMGVDVRVRVDGVSQVRRINFSGPVETLEQAKAALDAVCEGRVWEGAAPQDENA